VLPQSNSLQCCSVEQDTNEVIIRQLCRLLLNVLDPQAHSLYDMVMSLYLSLRSTFGATVGRGPLSLVSDLAGFEIDSRSRHVDGPATANRDRNSIYSPMFSLLYWSKIKSEERLKTVCTHRAGQWAGRRNPLPHVRRCGFSKIP
jgi:hypothetical protein